MFIKDLAETVLAEVECSFVGREAVQGREEGRALFLSLSKEHVPISWIRGLVARWSWWVVMLLREQGRAAGSSIAQRLPELYQALHC